MKKIRNDMDNGNEVSYENMPCWDDFRELHNNEKAWCYLNFFFMPVVVGKCLWVSEIQQQSKVRSLTTPSDEAFCLVVLRNNWALWTWECENPGVTMAYKHDNAPTVMYTKKGMGCRTNVHGGWSQEGISLYNKLVTELTEKRKLLDRESVYLGNGMQKSKMELLNGQFYKLAERWDQNNMLHLRIAKANKRRKMNDAVMVDAVQIFGWKDGTA